ncbi:MAG: DUF4012 domain-containing protein [Actinomycetota bacterium]|nr:DUF4012 domain-containing protein [Actinomycetota bacterium]
MAILVVLGLLVLDGTYVYVRLRSTMPAAADGLRAAADHFRDADLEKAEAEFLEAFGNAEAAEGLDVHPAYAIARWLPWVGNETDAVDALAGAARHAAEAGLTGVEAAHAMGAKPEGLASSVYRNGRVDFESLDQAAPFAADAHRLLEDAASLLDASPRPSIALLSSALDMARSEVARATEAARLGNVLLDALPGLLGRGTSRRYLLAFHSPSEARGTGGLIGLQGVLQARDGRLTLVRVGGILELIRARFPAPDAPGWFREHYGPLSALRQWQQANESPHFPVVSEVLLEMYESVYGERLDGVFAMDPLALQELLRATGPLGVEGSPEPVTADNVADLLMHDSFLEYPDPVAQNRYLEGLVRQFWSALQSGDVDGAQLGRAVVDAVRTHHLKMYSRVEADRAALRALEADGDYTRFGPNLQMVFHNNFAANKIDYFLQREVETTVTLTQEGEARVETVLTLDNAAPDGPPSVLLGNRAFTPYAPGLNGMFVNFLLPEEAQVYRFLVDGEQSPYILHRDGRFPVAWDLVEIPAGGTRTVLVRYRVQGVLQTDGDETTFSMALFPQALVRPDEVQLTVRAPEGVVLVPEAPDDGAATETFTTSGPLDETLEVRLRLERA